RGLGHAARRDRRVQLVREQPQPRPGQPAQHVPDAAAQRPALRRQRVVCRAQRHHPPAGRQPRALLRHAAAVPVRDRRPHPLPPRGPQPDLCADPGRPDLCHGADLPVRRHHRRAGRLCQHRRARAGHGLFLLRQGPVRPRPGRLAPHRPAHRRTAAAAALPAAVRCRPV
ncbi:hypothetical protein IWQ57_005781, partial [Coemansia nantahalensis]